MSLFFKKKYTVTVSYLVFTSPEMKAQNIIHFLDRRIFAMLGTVAQKYSMPNWMAFKWWRKNELFFCFNSAENRKFFFGDFKQWIEAYKLNSVYFHLEKGEA